MSEKSEAREQKMASIVKVADRNVHGIMELGDSFICDSAEYNTYHNIRDVGGCDASQISTGNAAQRKREDIYPSPSQHSKNISKVALGVITELQQETPILNIHQQTKQTLKHITTKHLQTLKRFTSNLKNTVGKISFLKCTQRKINKHTILRLFSKCKENTRANNTKNKTSIDSNLRSPIRNFIRIHRRKRRIISGNNTAIGMFLKLKLSLKSYITGFIIKSETSNKLKRCNHMCYEQPVIFNYIFPYRCSSSEIIEESDEQSETSYELNDSSTIILTSDSSTEPFSHSQEFRHQSQIRISMPIVDVDPCVRNNINNACRSDDVLIRHLNLDIKMNGIKTLRRVTLKRHQERFTNKSYRKSFNKKYQTYFAEINYMNQVLDLSSPCQQGVGIGSTWDFNIDFGRSPAQDLSAQCAENPNLCQIGDIKTGEGHERLKALKANKKGAGHTLPQYQCPPGVCTTSKCNPNKCYKRLKRTVPYGSHASSQARKYKSRDRRTLRKRSNGKHIGVGRGTKLVNNPTSLSSRGQPHRQKVRIESKTGFNIRFYKESPLGARSINGETNRDNRNIKHNRERRTTFECPPGICDPRNCKSRDCYQRLKAAHVGTQSRKIKGRNLRAGREKFYKEEGTLSMPRSKIQLNIPNRQAVRIGSKCSFNIDFYRSMPQNNFVTNGQSDTSDREKPGSKKKRSSIKNYQCEPGVCVPGECNANTCFKQLKSIHSQASSGSSKGTSQGSQASTKKKKLQMEDATFYKNKGSSSMPKSMMPLDKPNRQAVRIGSKCSFNINFYRSMPQNNFVTNGQSDTSDREKPGSKKKRSSNKNYQCEPGVCVPGECNANTCFKQLKSIHSQASTGSSKGTSQGSQASTKKKKLQMEGATFYENKGSSSMPRSMMPLDIPNRQAVRIGSKCSFNIQFYRSLPQNGYMMNRPDQDDNGISHKQRFQCKPDACIPGKCNASDCYQILKAKQKSSGVDSSLTGSISQGNQASTDTRKKKQTRKAEKNTLLYKDKGLSSMQSLKKSLQPPNRQAVRIGSKCSFNVGFYRSMPHNTLGMNEYNQSDSGEIYQQRLQCEPNVCIPGKCNANDCFLKLKAKTRLSGNSLTGSSNVMSQSSQASTKLPKNKKRQSRTEKSTYYRDKGVSSKLIPKNPYKAQRQAVRIASKCSFNIEFYRSMPQNDVMSRDPPRNLSPISYHQGDTYSPSPPKASKASPRKTGNKIISRNKYECEPKTCVPGKCDPRDCYKRLKSTPTSIVTDTSYADSSIGSNPVATQSSKLKGRKLRAGKENLFKEKGISSIPRHKQMLHFLNKQAVRIGSNCSFNIEFYKAIPHNMSPGMNGQSYEPMVNLPNNLYTGSNQKQIWGQQYSERYNQGDIPVQQFKEATERNRRTSNMLQCHPGACIPGKCDSMECYQRIRATNIVPGTEGSYTDSSYATSRGSQFSTKKRNNNRPQLSAGNATFYTDRGASNMTKSPRPKLNRQAVRIGSKCSFKIDFYKNLPPAPGKDMPQFEQPHVEQIQSGLYPEQLSSTETDEDQSVSAAQPIGDTRKKVKTKKKKTVQQRRQREAPAPHQQDKTRKPDKDRSEVQTKTKQKTKKYSPPPATAKRKLTKGKTLQTKKSLPKTLNDLKQNEQGDAIPKVSLKTQKRKSAISQDQGDIKTKTRNKRPKQSSDKSDEDFEYELGVCIPNKCDPYLCFERLRNRDGGTTTDATTSRAATTTSLKRKRRKIKTSSSGRSKSTSAKLDNAELLKQTEALPVNKNKGTSKKKKKANIDTIQPIVTGQNKNVKNVVRIGSTCSFNIQLYKEKPLTESELKAMLKSKEKMNFMSLLKNYCCKLIGNPIQTTAVCQGTNARRSQTISVANSNTCCRKTCPGVRKLTDASIGTSQPGQKCTLPCCIANAATQSRRNPLLHQLLRYEKSLSSAVCKCCGNFSPSRAKSSFRNMPPLYNNYMPLGPHMGYGDNFNGCQPCQPWQIREQAIIIGSGCGINLNFFKKHKK